MILNQQVYHLISTLYIERVIMSCTNKVIFLQITKKNKKNIFVI